MLCSNCNKKPAVVFISAVQQNNDNAKDPEGLCVSCAKEKGIKPVTDLLNKMGVTEDDINNMHEQFGDILNGDEINGLLPEDLENIGVDDEDDDFIKGGATTFPFIKGIMSDLFGAPKRDGNSSDIPGSKENNKEQEQKLKQRKHIDLYCTNLTEKAKKNELDRIVGREKEIGRVIQILCRRTKNNPCLIGEPGVGKTAIAEGLAIKMLGDTVPHKLKNKELMLLDLTALVAGTQFRGQFENRIKGLIQEVKTDGNIILFIDEVHRLVGTGDSSEGTMSAANILKPALSRGEVQVIGATTFTEFRKYIEKDAALERRFQSVKIEEPSIKNAIEVLKGIKDYYEKHHRVKISDNLLEKIAVLAERYITDRFLPDKAIDLMDEACTRASLRNKELLEYDKLSTELEKMKSEEEKMVAIGETADFEKLAEIRVKIAQDDEKIKKISAKALGSKVTEADLAEVIELWTGIPSAKIQENEFKKLEKLEEKLKSKVIGQEKAIKEIAAAIRRNRVQISPRRRPASFIFVGPTGVGKTELVKVLAEELFDAPETLIRLDMSEYMEKHAASRIVGSPPGYVGYDEAGQLTEKVRQKPYSVILFDEIEKAHPDVLNILLQILDEGKITDSHGRVVNFENTVIVMTSNAGSNKKDGALGFAKSADDLTKEKVTKALQEFLRPEFLSRLDEVVIFNNLTKEDYIKIAELMINEYEETLKERGIELSFDDAAIEKLAEKSFGGKSGARDLRNLIRRELEDKLTEIIVNRGGFEIKKVKFTGKPELKVVV